MKPYNERLPMIDAAIEYYKGKWPDKRGVQEDDRQGLFYVGSATKIMNMSHGPHTHEVEHICNQEEFEQRAKELGYINGYKWGVIYKNENHGEDLPDDLEISVTVTNWNDTGSIWLSKRTPKSLVGNTSGSFKITDERYMPKEQEMNNDWYKKGELPPVGSVVWVKTPLNEKSVEVEVVAYTEQLVIVKRDGHEFSDSKRYFQKNVKPEKFERDKLIEAAERVIENEYVGSTANNAHLQALYNAGMLKMPTEQPE